MKIIDTHLHILNKEEGYGHLYYDDFDEFIKINKANGVRYLFDCSDSFESFKSVLDLCHKYEGYVKGVFGIHPEFAVSFKDKYRDIVSFLNENRDYVSAIGEIGLDYHYDEVDENIKNIQKECFISQIEIARKMNLPIVIHSRDAENDTFEILTKYAKGLKIDLHCYSGSVETAKRYIQSGLDIHFGIGGVVTFNNAQKLVKVVEEISLKYLLTETDSPFLAPTPFRGKVNYPYYIEKVIHKIAEIKGMDVEEVSDILYENGYNFYFKENRNVYIVEGKTDMAKLSRFGFKYFILTNGLNLNSSKKNLIKSLKDTHRKVVLLLDPDNIGHLLKTEIIKILESNKIPYDNIHINKKDSYRNNKFGVNETDSTILKELLKDQIEFESEEVKYKEDYVIRHQFDDDVIIKLMSSSSLRKKICTHLNLDNYYSTFKTFSKALEMLKISNSDIKKLILIAEKEVSTSDNND